MALETELKLVCEPAVLKRIARHPAVRALKAGRARTEQLLSRYFDTPDRKLHQARVALRVRSTPRGWVQTVKAEGQDMHSRPEWEWPVSGDSPRGDVLADTPALKALGGVKGLAASLASLVPVFETEVRRTTYPLRFADGTLAELCLDSGEIRAGAHSEAISEAEIELRSGAAARLYELSLSLVETLPLRLGHASKAARGYALAAPAPHAAPLKAEQVSLHTNMSKAQAFLAVTAACASHLQANERGLALARDAEYLHQMRVGVRRVRSALRVFRDDLDPPLFAAVAAELQALGRSLGAARDWDVFCAGTLRVAAKAFPDRTDVAALARRGERARREHDRAARAAVADSRYTRGLLQLGQLAVSGSASMDQEPLTRFAARALQQRHRQVCKLGRDLTQRSAVELHELRIGAKKLRYATEFFQDLFAAKRARAYVRALSTLQDVLGHLNDFATGQRLLDEIAPAEHESGLVFLHGWLGAERQRQLEALPEAWAKFRAHSRFWRRSLPKAGMAATDGAAAPAPRAATVSKT